MKNRFELIMYGLSMLIWSFILVMRLWHQDLAGSLAAFVVVILYVGIIIKGLIIEDLESQIKSWNEGIISQKKNKIK